jgi:hypothetical protein
MAETLIFEFEKEMLAKCLYARNVEVNSLKIELQMHDIIDKQIRPYLGKQHSIVFRNILCVFVQ